jgi:hypothetical protein
VLELIVTEVFGGSNPEFFTTKVLAEVRVAKYPGQD